jgi:predicted DNA-binding protein (MmcQ/YjbR family)
MDVEWIRRVCMAFPHATEQVLWGADLVFKIGGKMFAAAPLEPRRSAWHTRASPTSACRLLPCASMVTMAAKSLTR